MTIEDITKVFFYTWAALGWYFLLTCVCKGNNKR